MRLMRLVSLLLMGFSPIPIQADVKPNPLFTDNAVLQRNQPIYVWGTANPGEEVYVALDVKTADGQASQGGSVKADDKGNWKVTLDALKSGTDGKLEIRGQDRSKASIFKNIAIGEVWIASGQSNMQWSINQCADPETVVKNSANPDLRLYYVERIPQVEPISALTKPSQPSLHRWNVSGPESVGQFSAVAYHFGVKLQKELGVPVGVIHTSWGGTPAEAWTSRPSLLAEPTLKHYVEKLDVAKTKYNPEEAKARFEKALAKFKEDKANAEKEKKPFTARAPQMQQSPGRGQSDPSSLYNGMISPLLPYRIAGAIWYQGESNANNFERATEYKALFATMIKDWRKAWGYDFPFYAVQLAPYMKIADAPTDTPWAYLREAQLQVTTKLLPKAGLAVITDVGEENDIHPKKKQPVGERLALNALVQVYGQKVEFSGPAFKELKIDGNKAVLHFNHVAGGLVCKGGKLTGFTIAGEDKKFYNAEATIEGETIIVTAKEVEKPIAVRFGWANYPVVNLWNKVGLPASPFRTDDFPVPMTPAKK
jgi:sialate O-acetylesterase